MASVESDVAVALDRTRTLLDKAEAHEIVHQQLERRLDAQSNSLAEQAVWRSNHEVSEDEMCARITALEAKQTSTDKKLDRFTVYSSIAIVVMSTAGKVLLDLGIELVKGMVSHGH